MVRKRDYRKEYDQYHGSAEQKKRRAERNRDRAAAEKAGRVKDGDGREVDHMGAPRTGSLAGSKTQVIAKRANRRKQPKR